METNFETRCEILAELWMNYREDKEFSEYMSYNDLGLPMAYIVANELGTANEIGNRFINEAWDLLLGALEIEDKGFDNLDELFGDAEEL